MADVKSDIEIARAARKRPILEIGEKLGIPAEHAHGSLRVTLGRGTTSEDIDHFIKVFPPIVDRLRQMSPIWCANCACKQRN